MNGGSRTGAASLFCATHRRLLMHSQGTSGRRTPAGLVAAAKTAAVACVTVALLLPANAQFWGPWGGREQRPQYRQQPQSYNPFGNWFSGPTQREREREAPADYSRAPAATRKLDASVTIPVLVMGDAMADWLAYGLEDAFAE